ARRPDRLDIAAVRELAYRHALSIPFENLDAFLGSRIELSSEAVQDKLVRRQRGGWCFEQNQLFGDALRALGIPVTDLAARVLWQRPRDFRAPLTHRALRITVDGAPWLVDTGFGVVTLTGALAFESGVEQETTHERHRLTLDGDRWLLEALLGEQWERLYAFDLHPQLPEDYEAVNFQLVHDPRSPFTVGPRLARALPDGRLTLQGNEFTRRRLGGRVERRELDSVDALLRVMADDFGLPVDDVPGLEAALAARVMRPR
ncbi:MAG: arylamine N-acetyltransferase, partial [Steroidobacteraceae bacterium]